MGTTCGPGPAQWMEDGPCPKCPSMAGLRSSLASAVQLRGGPVRLLGLLHVPESCKNRRWLMRDCRPPRGGGHVPGTECGLGFGPA